MIRKIYADNAATTKLDIESFEEMKPFLLDNYGNSSQPYSFGRVSKNALKKARRTIANCINAEEDEIFFTSCGTESNNWVLKHFGLDEDNRHIFVSEIEHHSVLNSATCYKIPVTKEGIVTQAELKKCFIPPEFACSCDSYLVSIMLANNEIGTIQDIKSLARIAHKQGAYFHTDAVQAIGHIKVDVKDLDIDFLSASAHKFNGPKGIGFLYIKKGTIINPLINGGSQEHNLRAGTENVAEIVGMAKALENNINFLEKNQTKLKEIEFAFINELKNLKIDFIQNGAKNHLPGLINISIKNANGEQIMHRLDLCGNYISTGSACDSVNNQVSHVIKAIKVPDDYAEGTIRISFGKNNTKEEAIILANNIYKILNTKIS